MRQNDYHVTHNHHRPQKRILLDCLPKSQKQISRHGTRILKPGVGRNACIWDAPANTQHQCRSGVVAILTILGIGQEFGQQIVQNVWIGGVL